MRTGVASRYITRIPHRKPASAGRPLRPQTLRCHFAREVCHTRSNVRPDESKLCAKPALIAWERAEGYAVVKLQGEAVARHIKQSLNSIDWARLSARFDAEARSPVLCARDSRTIN